MVYRKTERVNNSPSESVISPWPWYLLLSCIWVYICYPNKSSIYYVLRIAQPVAPGGHYATARYVSRIGLVRLMKLCFPVFRHNRDPHCRARTERKGCARTETLRALRPWKNEAEKWPSLRSQPPDNSIVRQRVGAWRFLHEPPTPCLPIPFGGRSIVNYSRSALRRIYTSRSWRSSQMNRPKWIRCMNAFLFGLFNPRSHPRRNTVTLCIKRL